MGTVEDEKGHLIDLLIHDLGTPLSVVTTTVTNLLQKTDRYGPLTEGQKGALERALRNSKKAQQLVEEMLEISRSREGVFQKERFPIEKTITDSFRDALEAISPDLADRLGGVEDTKELKSLLEREGIFVHMKGRYCETSFCHDRRKVGQILRNLINNGLKYRRRRLSLSIEGERDLIVSVEDDGLGIPLADQKAVFERFVRLKKESGPDVPGLGLGLAGVKALVEAMGGEIRLTSCEGGGACFTVRIPPLE